MSEKHYKELSELLAKHYKELTDFCTKGAMIGAIVNANEPVPLNVSTKLTEGSNIALCTSVKEISLKGTNGSEKCLKLKFKIGKDEIGCESISTSKMQPFSYKRLSCLKNDKCKLSIIKNGKRFKVADILVFTNENTWLSIWESPSKYSKSTIITNIKSRLNDIPALMSDICCKYDIKMEEAKFGQTVYRTEIDPQTRQTILDSAIEMWSGGKSGYRKLSTAVCGLYGEQCGITIINCLYDYFNVNRRLFLNTKKYRFTGDGKSDFIIEGISCDVKYRNSTKNDGMATKIKDVKADVLLLTTGATDYNDNYFETNDGSTHIVYFTGFTDKISFQNHAIKNGLPYSDLMDHPFSPYEGYLGMDESKKLKSADDFIHMILTKTLERLENYGNQ